MKHYIFSTRRRVSLLVLAGLLAILAGCFIDAIINVNDAGRIWSESGTINCSSTNPEQSDCQEEYLGGGEELFFAQPDPGHKFLGWSMGHCAGVGSCYVPWSEEDNPTDGSNTQHIGVTADFAPINPTPQTATYTYNAMGQRVTKTVNGVTTIYVYDIYGQLISEGTSVLNPNTQEYEYQTLREYIYFDGQVIAHIESSGGDFDGVHYVLNDHLGRPMQVLRDPTDPNNPNETLWAMETEAFGEETGTFQKAGFSHNKRFPGQYYDQETGLSYNYYRDYDPSIGRYIQPDPIGLKGGINLYGYVDGSPQVYTDPRGLVKLYGSWCGPDWTGGFRKTYGDLSAAERSAAIPPIDELDSCCQTHDMAYADCRELYPCDKEARAECMRNADRRLSSCASSASGDVSPMALLAGNPRDRIEDYMRDSDPSGGGNSASCSCE